MVEWDEEPFEWVRPERFGVVRRYHRGPLAEMRVQVELVPDDGGTRLNYEVDAQSRGIVGAIGVPVEIGVIARRRFAKILRAYDRAAAAATRPAPRVHFVGGGRERLARARDVLAADVGPGPAGRLADLLEHSDDLDLAGLRPYAVADVWGEARPYVLGLFLHAVKAGMLELRWEVLCPRCRGPAEQADSLSGLRGGDVHCESCAIEFGPDFDRSVELRFRPSPSIRDVAEHEFCVGGPQVTPHIAAQQVLAPGETREVRVRLEPGRYRLRSPQGSRFLVVDPDGPTSPDATGRVGPEAGLRMDNPGSAPAVVVLERAAWSDQATTAAEVTALQVFRDLFATEALRPGEQFRVGTIAVLFTDLRDSTRLYRRIGDASAFGAVMTHFDVLHRAIADEDGAIVKTMGDAVMAVFHRPVSAIRAVFRAQSELTEPLILKAGLHAGPCIAVTQNGRLDYFGSTVNIAARLVGVSTGGDIVVSDAILHDSEAAEVVAPCSRERVEATLKGFEDDRLGIWRLRAAARSV
jgi:class 3 adenylate cyclase